MYKGQSIYWYNAPFTNLLRSSEQSFTLQTQSGFDFECQRLMSNITMDIVDVSVSTAQIILEGQHYPGILLQIVEENTGQRWWNVPTSVPNVCGVAQSPAVLPQTKLLARSTSLHVTLINKYTTVDFPLLNITFFGRRLYT